ncbi:hypothetical protein HYQ46_010600 [Verticillium longisporum]|nr:hypothetical protein HYQ46_010600 [Verticillium longisporum]
MALLRARVGVNALIEKPLQRLHVVRADGCFDDAAGLVQAGASGYERRQEVSAEVRDALESRVLRRHQVGIGLVGEEKRKDIVAVIADGSAQRGVDAVFLEIGVNTSGEQEAHRLDVVNANRQLHASRGLLAIGPTGEKQLETFWLIRCRPKHMLRAREVGVRAMVE